MDEEEINQEKIIDRILAQTNLNPHVNEPARHYIFDGDGLAEYKGIDQTNVWPAMSGYPELQNARYQYASNGPMPSGRYFLSKNKIEHKDDADWWDKSFGWAKSKESVRNSWGDYRVELEPENWDRMRGRHGIYGHGGKEFKSAGCLDLTDSGMNDFVKKIRTYPQEDYILDVIYPDDKDFRWQKK